MSAPRLVSVAVDAAFSGLVGQEVDGILGYDPRSATELMSKIILYAGK